MRSFMLALLLVACAPVPRPPPPTLTAKEAAAEEQRLAEAERAAARDVRDRALLLDAVGAAPLGSSLLNVAGAVLIEARASTDPSFQPVNLVAGNARTVVFRGAVAAETFWMWDAFRQAISPHLRALSGRPSAGWRERMRDVANLLLHDRLGSDLFDMEHPGAFHRPALAKLLGALNPKPTHKLLGTTIKVIYPLIGPSVREYVATHAVLTAGQGRTRALDGAARFEADNPRAHLAGFYEDHATREELGRKVALRTRWSAGFITGFWVRRMRDGTDDLIADHLRNILARHDPKFTY